MLPDYRAYRLFETHTEQMAETLQVRFLSLNDQLFRSHSTFEPIANRLGKLSHYLPLSRLEGIVDSLIAGEFDGLKICYGLSESEPGSAVRSYELILTEVKIGEYDPLKKEYTDTPGLFYHSTDDFAASPILQDGLRVAFRQKPGHSTASGTFIGLNQLQELVAARAVGFEGLEMWFGMNEPKAGQEFGGIMLLIRLVKWGSLFVSVSDASTEPTGIGCPPLSCAPPPPDIS
jgi:hypothetical protein